MNSSIENCRLKRTFNSRQDAKRAASKGSLNLKPYKCPHCGLFHLTSQTGADSRAARKKLRMKAKERKSKVNKLIHLTHQMRQEQRSYFKTKDSKTLTEARKLERLVDDLLDELRGQGRLF